MYELYQRVAPRPEDFPKLLDKIGATVAGRARPHAVTLEDRARKRWTRPAR
ncbi:hypothetical protein JOL79_19980 [Microbispora sp. RL4-1S]|uniref:Uncharacterized protein n=1 Tax=Microbispora oryzae TaxID=2806554 RepID=A0A941AJB8_9ACTN|nr:hypothetical protein [Microbispora oryzae]MBP2706091.1 hypothetical protein [Microbispora oryzae]